LAGTPWERRRPALQRLFEGISPGYDRLNRVLSFGLDRGWRRWAAAALEVESGGIVLDLASGTGELAKALLERSGGLRVARADLSPSLLRIGAGKLGGAVRGGGSSPAIACEMDRLPLREGAVDGIVQGFALRHCRSFATLFSELFRVLRPGGRISLLDMRYPRRGAGAKLYRLYFRAFLPRVAAALGGERAAYEMMVESVRSLPEEEELMETLRACGFSQVRSQAGFLGAVRLLTGRRPAVR
jgi:demethylmenaquinone methyltransferase/2-methoxy-6-polyprenyl-1,4-benzoquinol methylase